jgi:hypothetical protein
MLAGSGRTKGHRVFYKTYKSSLDSMISTSYTER